MLASRSWWIDGKFGMFVHWGLYSLLAGEYQGRKTDNIAEWIMHDLDIPPREYRKLADEFTAEHFDADFIAALAKEAGMRYLVFTSKHHDGFALYHSKASSYNSVEAAKAKRDFVQELREACDKHGLVFGLYYSQAQDWDEPNAYRDGYPKEGRDFDAYFREKCLPQIQEILTEYGEIGLLWLDTPMYMSFEQSTEIRDLIRKLQPNCLISGRIGNGLGDYMTTGDNFIPLLPYDGLFEVPATINATWGYNRYDTQWKSAQEIIRSMVKIVSRGGNYLLNIGPKGDGEVPQESVEVLKQVGRFMDQCGESIYTTVQMPVYPYDIEWGYFTARANKLYIHVFAEKETAYLLNIANKPTACYRLRDKLPLTLKERTTGEGDSSWLISLPPREADEFDQVICVEVEGETIEFEPIKE